MTTYERSAEMMGEEAYKNGKSYMECPFPDKTQEAKAWKNGYLNARNKKVINEFR